MKTSPRKFILIGGLYRQWRLPQSSGQLNTGTGKRQLDRFKKFLNQVKHARQKTDKVVFLGDINIDILEYNDSLQRYEMKELLLTYLDFLNNNSYVILNKDPTRHSSNSIPSCIDHIVTNVPGHLDNVCTHINAISDHSSITCDLHYDELNVGPRLMRKTNWWALTSENLLFGIENNKRLNKILHITNPEIIWSEMIIGLI